MCQCLSALVGGGMREYASVSGLLMGSALGFYCSKPTIGHIFVLLERLKSRQHMNLPAYHNALGMNSGQMTPRLQCFFQLWIRLLWQPEALAAESGIFSTATSLWYSHRVYLLQYFLMLPPKYMHRCRSSYSLCGAPNFTLFAQHQGCMIAIG